MDIKTTTRTTKSKVKFNTLYKRNKNGSVQQWTMIVEGNKYWAEYGQVDGKIQSDTPTVAEAKNVGRSNETSSEEQAYSEARSKWEKKIKRNGYWKNIEDIDTFVFSVMLAHNSNKHKHKLEGKPMFVSPKLDGFRCYITKDGAYSRNGEQYVTTKFIEEHLEDFCSLDRDTIQDG